MQTDVAKTAAHCCAAAMNESTLLPCGSSWLHFQKRKLRSHREYRVVVVIVVDAARDAAHWVLTPVVGFHAKVPRVAASQSPARRILVFHVGRDSYLRPVPLGTQYQSRPAT